MAPVLVTGGTGFLGAHLVQQLRGSGVPVRALVRDPARAGELQALGAELIAGDLGEPASLEAAFATPPDAVFHAAADTSTWAGHRERQARVNIEGTRALVAAAQRHGVSAFIHTSSVASFSHLQHEELREDLPRLGGQSWIHYERSKYLGEEAVREAMAQGLRAVICYPAHILGPGDRQNWARMIQIIDRGRLPGAPPGCGAFADVREVARAEIEAWRRQRWGESYLLGGEAARFVDLIALIGAQLGRRTPRRALPAFVLRAYARLQVMLAALRGREPEVTPEAAAFTCQMMRVDSSKAMRELDYGVTPLPRLVAETIAWMRDAGMLTAARNPSRP